MRPYYTVRTIVVIGSLLFVLGMSGTLPHVQASSEPHHVAAVSPFGLSYQWHSFYGVNASVGASRSVGVDASGNVYIAGYANASWGSPLHAYSGGYDIVVTKLSSTGAYQWHSYYGASPTTSEDGDDEAYGIAIDPGGNVYVTGYSDRSWQGPGNVEPILAHGADAEYMFVLKLDSSGAYQWHTFVQPGRARAIAVDSTAAYITGYAARSWNTPLHASPGTLLALKLNSSGVYQWHSYYGAGSGAEEERGNAIAIDTAHQALYISGQSQNSWQGDNATAALHDFSGGAGYSNDIVVLKLNTNGGYAWHTFYGASGTDDIGAGVSFDRSGSPFIAATSSASWASPLHAHSGEADIAILQLSSTGSYQWHTFYGSDGQDEAAGISVNASGIAYIVGQSAKTWAGPGNQAPLHTHSGGLTDSTVLKISNDASYLGHSFYGAGDGLDQSAGIALGPDQDIFVTGLSPKSWLGAGNSAALHAHSGNSEGDSFILKLSDKVRSLYLPLAQR